MREEKYEEIINVKTIAEEKSRERNANVLKIKWKWSKEGENQFEKSKKIMSFVFVHLFSVLKFELFRIIILNLT